MKLLTALLAATLLAQQPPGSYILIRPGGVPAPVGSVSSLSVAQPSPTQAVITFTAPSAPVVQISEKPDFSTLTNDSNPALFSQADLASKPGSIQNGTSYQYVAGKRGTDLADGTDLARKGAYFSRALKAATLYYVRAFMPGNVAAAVSTTFTTGTIPFGMAYLEGKEVDPLRPGTFKDHTLIPSLRNIDFAEPRTGLSLKRMTLPSDSGEPISAALDYVTAPSGWTIGGTSVALSTANTTAKLFLTNTGGAYTGGVSFFNTTSYTNVSVPTYYTHYQAVLTAAVNVGGVAPANPADGVLSACLTQDGNSCYPGSAILDTAPLTVAVGAVSFLSGNTAIVGDLWKSTPGTSPPDYTAQAAIGGTAVCNNTSTVTTSDLFSFWMQAGSNIRINNVDYRLADSTNTNSQLTIVGTCPTGSYSFVSRNFGLLIWKKTVTADTISIASANVNAGMGLWAGPGAESGKYCSEGQVTDPLNGHPLYICRIDSSAKKYAVDSITGDSHFIANPQSQVSTPIQGNSTSTINPSIFYGYGTGVYQQNPSVYKMQYFGDYREPTPIFSDGFMYGIYSNAGTRTCNGNTASAVAGNPCIEFTDTSNGMPLSTLVVNFTSNAAYAPSFDPSKFQVIDMVDLDSHDNVFLTGRPVSPVSGNVVSFGHAWLIVYNPTATGNSEGGLSSGLAGNHGCTGGGKPGCVMAAMPKWARPGCRWCQFKDGLFFGDGYINTSTYVPQYAYAIGPYSMQMVDGTADGSSNTIDGSLSLIDCPVNSYGAPTTVGSKQCTQVTVSSEPTPYPGAGINSQLAGELGNSAVGDFVTFGFSQNQSANGERQQILTKRVGAAAGTFVFALWRDIANDTRAPYGYTKNFGAGTQTLPLLVMDCNAAGKYEGNPQRQERTTWNFVSDPHGMNEAMNTPDAHLSLGHNGGDSRGDWIQIGAASGFGGIATPLTPGTPGLSAYNDYAYRSGKGKTFAQVVDGSEPVTYQKAETLMAGNPYFTSFEKQSHPGIYATLNPASMTADYDGMWVDARNYRGGGSSGNTGGSASAQILPQQPAVKYAGDLWDFSPDKLTMQVPYSKFWPIFGVSGRAPLLNISSPAQGNVISTGAADNYKYCIAAVAGECRADSIPNHLYVNAPHVSPNYAGCYIIAQANSQDPHASLPRDICVSAIASNHDSFIQAIGDLPTTNPISSPIRTLFRMGPRVASIFANLPMTSDNRWAMTQYHLGTSGTAEEIFLAQMPPRGATGGTPGVPDSIDRSNFLPVAVNVPTRANSTAYLRFGISENDIHPEQTGSDDRFLNCTSRKEFCATSNTATWLASDMWSTRQPFIMELTEALSTADAGHGYTPSTLVPVDVSAAGTTIYLPGIPSHVMYYEVVYKDKASGALTVGPLQVTAVQ